MKMTLVILGLLASGSAFAKDLNCTGTGTYRGRQATTTVTMTQADGLKVGDYTNDGASSSSVTISAKRVEHWNEGGVQALGRSGGLRIYLLSETEATMYRLEGWGVGEPNGVYTHLICK